ncbi:MAG: tetratricopeptide repeat protein [Planctomycetota bacterium]
MTRALERTLAAVLLVTAPAATGQETRPYADAQGVEGVVEALLEQGDAQRAVEQALLLVDKEPDSPRAQLLLARAYLLQAAEVEGASALSRSANELIRRDAEVALAKAIDLGSKDALAFLLQAELLDQRGEASTALAIVERGLAVATGSPDLLVLQSALLGKQGDHQRALGAAQSAVAIVSDHFDAGLAVAREQELLGHEQEALAAARELAKRHPERDDLCFLLWELHGRQGRFDRAVACYRVVVEEQQKSPWAWLYLGASERRANQLADAEQHLEKALELAPDSLEIQNEIGSLRQVQGKIDEAAKLFARVAREPSTFQEQAQERVLQLAGTLAKSLKFDQAIELFDELLKIDPRNYFAASNRALALRQAGHVDAAEAAYRQAMVDFPNDRQLTNDLALLLLGVGRRDAARAMFAAAEQLGSIDATENLAMIDLARGDVRAAEERLVTVLERDPTRARALVALESARGRR